MSDSIVPLDHQLLTADEVAELLRLPVSTIYDLARTGRLPSHDRLGVRSALSGRPGLPILSGYLAMIGPLARTVGFWASGLRLWIIHRTGCCRAAALLVLAS